MAFIIFLSPSVLATLFVKGVWVLKQTFQHASEFSEFLGGQHEIISKNNSYTCLYTHKHISSLFNLFRDIFC